MVCPEKNETIENKCHHSVCTVAQYLLSASVRRRCAAVQYFGSVMRRCTACGILDSVRQQCTAVCYYRPASGGSGGVVFSASVRR